MTIHMKGQSMYLCMMVLLGRGFERIRQMYDFGVLIRSTLVVIIICKLIQVISVTKTLFYVVLVGSL